MFFDSFFVFIAIRYRTVQLIIAIYFSSATVAERWLIRQWPELMSFKVEHSNQEYTFTKHDEGDEKLIRYIQGSLYIYCKHASLKIFTLYFSIHVAIYSTPDLCAAIFDCFTD